MKHKTTSVLMAAMALSLGFSGMASAQDAAPQHYTFGLMLSAMTPYFATIKSGAEAEAKKLGVQLLVEDGNNNSITQNNQIDTLIARKVNLLLINPTDAKALVPAVEKANAAHIPVIYIDRKADGGHAIAYFASDNTQAGAQACQYIANKLHGQGNLFMLLGISGASATNERTAGCESVLKSYPHIKVVARQSGGFSREGGLTVMRDVLIANPKLNAVYSENGEMAIGAMRAAAAAGRLKGLTIAMIGSGSFGETQLVKQGKIALSVAQQPAVMGALGVQAGYSYLSTGTVFVPVPLHMDLAPSHS
ncbi:substrate-binding domain-containing protein [Acidithiobacillus thiooxidans]|uniref:Ribose import binding protein RbsB n=1 Tax=Acidithiobacillus thiooxidans ATCC 19377 TaxID=637390 RepID=A0A543Q701_ACITH|nr:substrate-binding domain-containing protein [Acidithiobacillus thiooxidans]MDR7928591.1 substrate-binding domain-containing protein [Acidithiobacillus thiooxidans]MDX5933695.1 substrate-binding domain-containing protein [Acidithiobacillus thiooxidans]TQN52090.1 Ribose import binding protein RbsB [Acidithiobacillus thiooxidans ATCC 19377]